MWTSQVDSAPILLTLLSYFMAGLTFCQGDCAPGYFLDNTTSVCGTCPHGTYKPSAGDELHCTACPESTEGLTRVTLHTAATSVDQCFTWPALGDFTPDFGPIAGGTAVNISLKSWEKYNVTFILLANSVCSITSHSSASMTVVCTTDGAPEPREGVAKLTFNSDTMLISNKTFKYQQDPIVTSIDDLRTIVSGGLLVKIYGEKFDSVAQNYFIVTRISYGITRIFAETSIWCLSPSGYFVASILAAGLVIVPLNKPCAMVSPELLHCKTPNLGDGLVHYLLNEVYLSPGLPERRRREVTPPTFNDENNQFYAGMRMDGVEKYTNISSALPDYGQMMVYQDPVFYQFEEEDNVKLYNPEEMSFLDIKGMHLNYACDVEDMTVTIGQGMCNVTFLATNVLSCSPPSTQPEPDNSGHGKDRTPRVTVYVGNFIFFIGYLKYGIPGSDTDVPVDKQEEDTTSEILIGALAGGVISLLVLVFMLVMVVIVCQRNRQGRKNIKHLGGSQQQARNSTETPRYIERKPSVLTNVVYTETLHKDGSVLPVIYDDTDGSNNSHPARPREMSVTISPPGTPGQWSVVSDSPTYPVYQNCPDPAAAVVAVVPDTDVLKELDESLVLNVQECMLESESLTLHDIVGVGYFGKVYKGILTRNEEENIVAVKTIQGSHFSLKEVGGFLEEAVMMKDFNHTNVLSLIGIVMKENRPLVVLPFMEHGDLKSYIRDPAKSIKVKDLLGFGQQVATGMSYLTSQKFVHRDLATRNCMLNKEMQVKIADFGLSRDVYKSDYYRVEDKHRPLPVRWMAVESLTSGLFSSKSDVWSFGVTLWELLTRGCSPYPDVDTFNIKAYVLSGRRLSQPEHAPDEVYELMCRCWLEEPHERPSFEELKNHISDILTADDDCRHDYAKLVLVS